MLSLHHPVARGSVSSDRYFYIRTAEQQALIRERFEASKDEIDEDSQPLDPSELVRKEWSVPMEPPETLVLPILPYQKEGLGWMYHQEHSQYHGGILADEMVHMYIHALGCKASRLISLTYINIHTGYG